MSVLLDTHILVHWLEDEGRLGSDQKLLIEEADADDPLLVAGITLWEIATLHELGRIELDRPLLNWLERATASPLVRTCPITPRIADRVASLPDSFHRDPADRIIVSTALEHGVPLLTLDDKIIEARLAATVPGPETDR